MAYHDVEMICSAPSMKDWPSNELPEFILAGRSNVGKSSFINTVIERKSAAYVGKTPGKTRMLNFFKIDNKFMFVDVPGYGFATRSQRELVDFGNMMEDYFNNRQNVKAIFMIVDFRHKPTNDDVTMIDYARNHHVNTYVIATKSDKIKNSEWHKNLNVIAETLNIAKDSIIPFSSFSKIGIDSVWNKINELLTSK